jgi:hypothetical protein
MDRLAWVADNVKSELSVTSPARRTAMSRSGRFAIFPGFPSRSRLYTRWLLFLLLTSCHGADRWRIKSQHDLSALAWNGFDFALDE